MHIKTISVGQFDTNCHVVSKSNGKAIVVDPGDDAETIATYLKAERLQVAAYLITHGHVDHISGLATLANRFPAVVRIHKEDAAWAFGSQNHLQPYYDAPVKPASPIESVSDGDEMEDAEMKYRVLGTPGHTPGSVCFHFYEAAILFSGDTLFSGSVGRTDLQGGDPKMLAASIAKLAALDPAIKVYSGHGPATDIGREKKYNFFMRGL